MWSGIPDTRKRPKELEEPPFVGPPTPNKSGVFGRRRVPRSLALRPSNLVPGTVPWIAPRTGLAVLACPFGQDEMYVLVHPRHNALIHELPENRSGVIPEVLHVVDELWILVAEVSEWHD